MRGGVRLGRLLPMPHSAVAAKGRAARGMPHRPGSTRQDFEAPQSMAEGARQGHHPVPQVTLADVGT